MPSVALRKPKDSGKSTQRIRQSRLFVLLPALILGLLLADLIWEVVRANVHMAKSVGWPWRLSILGVATAATMAGVLAGLILTRQQFARSVRPALGWVGRETQSSLLLKGPACWSVVLFNGGAGHCVLLGIRYQVHPKSSISSEASGPATESWVDFDGAKQRLEALDLCWEVNVALELLGPGAPLPSVQSVGDGDEVAAFDREAVKVLEDVLMKVQVSDASGDDWERTISCLKGVDEWTEHTDPSSTGAPGVPIPKPSAIATTPDDRAQRPSQP